MAQLFCGIQPVIFFTSFNLTVIGRFSLIRLLKDFSDFFLTQLPEAAGRSNAASGNVNKDGMVDVHVAQSRWKADFLDKSGQGLDAFLGTRQFVAFTRVDIKDFFSKTGKLFGPILYDMTVVDGMQYGKTSAVVAEGIGAQAVFQDVALEVRLPSLRIRFSAIVASHTRLLRAPSS